MPLGLLDLFKYLLIALIWLFFMRVLRAVWVEVKPAAPRAEAPAKQLKSAPKKRKESEPSASESVLRVKITGPEGKRLKDAEIRSQGTVGRSGACTVPLGEDEFASGVHARIFFGSSGFMVEDLGSTNGTSVNGSRIDGPTPVSKGDRIGVGKSVLEVTS